MASSSFSYSQPCDPCAGIPWGPAEEIVMPDINFQGLPLTCVFEVRVEVQKRYCGGVLQVRQLGITTINTAGSCNLYCSYTMGLMHDISVAIMNHYNRTIVLYKESTCHYIMEMDLDPAVLACLGVEALIPGNLNVSLPCGTDCCITEFNPLPGGGYNQTPIYSEPCSGSIPSPLPTTYDFKCYGPGGVVTTTTVALLPPVHPDSVYCSLTCSGSGGLSPLSELQESDAVEEIQVYPNPTSGTIIISDWENWENITVFNILGEKVLSAEIKDQEVDMSDLPSGQYKILLESNGIIRTHSVFKQD